MPHDQLHSPIAVKYAEALLQLTKEPGEAEVVGQELNSLRTLLLDYPMGQALLVDPAIGMIERQALLDRVFKGRVSDLMLNFLHVVGEKGRLNLLISIAGAYKELLEKRQCKVEVDVTVVRRLDDTAFESVRQRIASALKLDVVLHQYVDERILGGMILRVQDKLIDGSVRTQLTALREKILAAPNRA